MIARGPTRKRHSSTAGARFLHAMHWRHGPVRTAWLTLCARLRNCCLVKVPSVLGVGFAQRLLPDGNIDIGRAGLGNVFTCGAAELLGFSKVHSGRGSNDGRICYKIEIIWRVES